MVIVYEFYLKSEFRRQAFDALCKSFYGLGTAITRKVDDADGSAVYAISRNPSTHWVQLLVDDNTPQPILTAIEARINGLCDTRFARYTGEQDNVAPVERRREVIGI